jgi:hypothetical protein
VNFCERLKVRNFDKVRNQKNKKPLAPEANQEYQRQKYETPKTKQKCGVNFPPSPMMAE